jgi:apyrase
VYGGKTHAVKGSAAGAGAGTADAAACKAVVDEVLALDAACEVADQAQCSFNGAWDGTRGPGAQTFYLSSYLFDRVSQAGLVDGSAASGVTTPDLMLGAAHKACQLTPAEVVSTFDGVDTKDAPYFCHDMAYAHSLLTKGYKLADSKQVTMVKQVEYKGQNIEAAWPLGAAINALSE